MKCSISCEPTFHVYDLGDQPDADLGPVISKASKERIERLIQSGIDEGANVRCIR